MSDYPKTCDACGNALVGVYPYTCHLWDAPEMVLPDSHHRHKAHYVCDTCRTALLMMGPVNVGRKCPRELTEIEQSLVTLGSQP